MDDRRDAGSYLRPMAYAESGGIGTQSKQQGSQTARKQSDGAAAKGVKLTAREDRELSVRLDGAGMLRFVPESEARELADILTVRKSWDAAKKVWRLRLLFDRRRRNSVDTGRHLQVNQRLRMQVMTLKKCTCDSYKITVGKTDVKASRKWSLKIFEARLSYRCC